MRLWKKKDPVPDNTFRQGPAAPHNTFRQGPAAPHGGPAMPQSAGDPGLPGSAGYRQARANTPLARFNFVRPDGKPDPKQRKGY